MSKAVYLSRSHHEKIRRCRMLRPKPSAIGEASHRFAPGLARSPLRGTSNTRHPSHSQYRFAFAHGLHAVTTPRGLSLGMRPLIPRLHCVSPNPRSGDCKMYVNHDNRARGPCYHDLRILLFSCHGEKGKSELQHAFCVLVSLFLRNWATIARGDGCQSSISSLLFRRPLRRKEKNGTK